MTTHIAEAASSWRTRTAVVFLLLVAGVGAVFAMTRDAQAALPTTTGSLTQVPATGGANINPGSAITYSALVTTSAANTNGAVVISITAPAGTTVGAPTCPAAAVGGAAITWTASAAGTNPATCTSSAILTAAMTNAPMSVIATAGTGNVGTASASVSDADAIPVALTSAASVGPLNVAGVTGVGQTVPQGQQNTITFTIPIGLTYCSDLTGASARLFTAPDQTVNGLTVVSTTPTTALDTVEGFHTVVVTDPDTPPNGGTVTISTHLSGSTVTTDCTDTTVTLTAANFIVPQLWHWDENAVPANRLIPGQHVNNNVRGATHVVCLAGPDATAPYTPAPVQIPLAVNNILVDNGGGYKVIGDQTPTFTDRRVFTGDGTNGLLNATCFSWVSTGAGDQQVTAEYTGQDGVPYQVAWRNNIGQNEAIIKEWNVLEESCIALSGGVTAGNINPTGTGAACGSKDSESSPTIEVNVGAAFNPATSTYEIAAINVQDAFWGRHINRAGRAERHALQGVEWNVDIGACGALSGVPALQTDRVTGANGLATFTIDTDADCKLGDSIIVTVTGREPGPLGSGAGNVVTQVIKINLVTPVATKQVFLAWAGQRVILEHDWRIPPGDHQPESGPQVIADGQCAFGSNFAVDYIKGSGPGNFLPSLGAQINGADHARVTVSSDATQYDARIPQLLHVNGAQAGCISRVLFESEDQGQVDIEAFVTSVGQIDGPIQQPEGGFNQTKVAFVIYYMKINSVDTTLVTSQNVDDHNETYGWWNPGNPWDESQDVTETEWNVSEDLLVRVRVEGWFTNSNPSGRARDDSNALNVLPADRWVMPWDWPLLAGGPAGDDATGVAETFRPEYDIMTAPDSGLLCDLPLGPCQEAVVYQGPLTSGTKVLYGIPAPVEGPYSLLDFPGPGSAALSNWVPNDVRETILRDADVDRWDAPMPPALVTVDIAGSGFIKEADKTSVYWTGTKTVPFWTNQFYAVNIPDSPFIPAVVAGGGYFWDSWGNDGPGGNGDGVYWFWQPIPELIADVPGTNPSGVAQALTAKERAELAQIRVAYDVASDGSTIGRTLVVYSDNHGEAMVVANGDFKLTYDDCATNALAGGHHCEQGDVVGSSSIFATADYPDFRGKHPPIQSFSATVDWTWGGYKEVTVEDDPNSEQFKYVVFHALDRDGYCRPLHTYNANGTLKTTWDGTLLHPVLTSVVGPNADDDNTVSANQPNGDPNETVDFLIDGGEGKIVGQSGGGVLSPERGAADGLPTFSTELNPSKAFPTLHGSTDECQAWIKISSSLLDLVDVLVIAHDDEGNIGFDSLIDFTSSMEYTLTFRWSLVTWLGADGISPSDALKGTGANAGGSDIFDQVTAIYGWEGSSQTWLGYFPAGENVPGANDLNSLTLGNAYWIAIKGPGSVTWTVVTDVN